jgi:hypothetical protein
MEFKSILKNRLYAFPSSKNFLDEDSTDLIQNIFKHTKKLNIPESDQIELIDINLNYDTYLIDFADQSVCLKISFDKNNDLLKREFNLLNKLNGEISPHAIFCDSLNYGEKVHYSITSFEELPSFKENGHSELFKNLNNFFIKLDLLHNIDKPKESINWIEYYLSKYLNFENLPEESSFFSIRNPYNFNIFKKIISDVNLDIKNLLKSNSINKEEFCHGNLKPSNILNVDDEFKFINFENHFSGNKYFDIASLSINFQLNREIDKDFFENYLDYKKINFTSIEWQSYRNCYNIILRKVLIEILINFLMENIALSRVRPIKIFELACLYSYNQENFQIIQAFRDNYKFINDIFSEIILNAPSNE